MSAAVASRPRRRPDGRKHRPGFAARAAAVSLYANVVDRGRALDALLDPASGAAEYRALEARDRRLVHAIVATALRRRGEIAAAFERLMERRPHRRSGPLMRILEIAAAQVLFMDIPDHAAVSIALDQIGADKDARHFKGLANAVLRRVAASRDSLLAGVDAARVNTPDWLWRSWVGAYGEEKTRRIAEAHLVEPALDLTVKNDPAAWAERLGGIVLPTGSVRLVPAGPVEELPGYAGGEWWVQDAAAALPARVMGDVRGLRVADLCAAPGGKTAALAHAGAMVTAVDISAERLRRLSDNLARLRLTADIVAADILSWTPPEPFDAVLLDAPCSATGTIRRHPDIPHLKRQEDIGKLAVLQDRMIDAAIRLLKPGGVLVFCTCSLQPEEGEERFGQVVAKHGLQPLPITAEEIGGMSEAITEKGTIRTLPCHLPHEKQRLSGIDGFFVGRCRKG